MRITLGGYYSLVELTASVGRLTNWLHLNEIEEVKGVNIYLQTLRNRRTVELVDECGAEIKHLLIDGPSQQVVRAVAIFEPNEADHDAGSKTSKDFDNRE